MIYIIVLCILAVVAAALIVAIVACQRKKNKMDEKNVRMEKELNRTNDAIDRYTNNEPMSFQMKNVTVWTWDSTTRNYVFYNTGGNNFLQSDEQSKDKNTIIIHDSVFAKRYIAEEDRHVKSFIKDMKDGKSRSAHFVHRVYMYGNREHKEWVNIDAITTATDKKGRATSILGYHTMVTQSEEAEAELQAQRQTAEQEQAAEATPRQAPQPAGGNSDYEISYITSIHDEINRPLSFVLNACEQLKRLTSTDEKAELLNRVERRKKQIMHIVRNVACLSKIESGKWIFNIITCPLDDVLKEMYQEIRETETTHNDLPFFLKTDDIDELVRIDTRSLLVIFRRLCDNAFKFTEKGQITMGYEDQGSKIRFYVSDTGCGIADHNRKTIFNKCVKIDTSLPGAGLGLPICQYLVESLGGEIGVDSEPGKGSTFWFTMPHSRA